MQQPEQQLHKLTKQTVTDPGFLEEFEREATWAQSLGITRRTSQNYRLIGVDGDCLPYIHWAGEVWIHKPGGAEFIARRIRIRNQTRG